MEKSKLKCDKCGHIHTAQDRKPAKSKAYFGQTCCPECWCVYSKVIEPIIK